MQLFVARLLADHDRCPQTMRKALTYKDAVPKHQCCGMFCHLLDCLERNAPATQFKDMQDRLHKMFMESFMDPDLLHMVSSEVPPGDLKTVAAFRRGVRLFRRKNAGLAARNKYNELIF